MIRLLLCDDEPLAVERLRDLVGRVSGTEVVGIATNGRTALEAVAALAPDAILLDIEMPALDGFDVVEALAKAGGPTPLIVFVTAYPQFAAHAFDTGAIDFLTKPVRLVRLETALERVSRALAERSSAARLSELAQQLESLRGERRGEISGGAFLWVQRRGENVRIDLLDKDGNVIATTLTDKNGAFRLEMPQIIPIFGQPHGHLAYDSGEFKTVFLRPVMKSPKETSLEAHFVLQPA